MTVTFSPSYEVTGLQEPRGVSCSLETDEMHVFENTFQSAFRSTDRERYHHVQAYVSGLISLWSERYEQTTVRIQLRLYACEVMYTSELTYVNIRLWVYLFMSVSVCTTVIIRVSLCTSMGIQLRIRVLVYVTSVRKLLWVYINL